MIRFLLILLVILQTSFVIVKSQLQGQAKIDSLLKEIPKMKEDTNAVNLYVKIAFEFSSVNSKKGIDYSIEGMKLAEKIKWKKGVAMLYSTLGTNQSNLNLSEEALHNFEKSYQINKEINNIGGQISNLLSIGTYYRKLSDYSKSLEYYEKALDIVKKNNLNSQLSPILGRIGTIYTFLSKYEIALDYSHKSLVNNRNINDMDGVSNDLIRIGNIHFQISNYSEALKFYFEALEICELLRNNGSLSIVSGNIGAIYLKMSNEEKALKYFLEALDYSEKQGNLFSKASHLSNIGSIYSNQGNYDLALDYLLKAQNIAIKIGDKLGQSINATNIGLVYKNTNDYSKAYEYYKIALEINEEIENKSGIASCQMSIGELTLDILSRKNDLQDYSSRVDSTLVGIDLSIDKSINYLVNSAKVFNELGELQNELLSNKILYSVYELKGNYKKAFETFKEYKTLQDSVFSMDKQKEFANLDAKRENDIKDKEIVILQTEKKAQQFQSYLLGGGVIVLFGAFGVAFLRFREKKKLSDKLAIQKSEIETQKSIVEEKNEQITASITYASTIQSAILPWDSTLKNAFSDILIYYKPKDIVSGDSYWFKEVEGIKFLAVIDCTGHGIPGAMLTVIASTALDDAVLGKRLSDTGQILTFMNEKVTEVLNQRLEENKIRDGMEVCMLAIHQDKIQFSGAGRPLYLKNGSMEIIKTDKRGIAGQTDNDEYQFSAIDIKKSENLMLYLASDGYADQMNENSKKYSTKRFVALLDSISDKPINEQHETLENEFNSHKGGRSQIDDVTIIGVKI
ncbi:MAG: tetratricopeptide repeat protein [Ignavibacteriae bacterium]|nr:tetratricopeptide repeat protein [Ignavibacteriota bacterium]